MAYSSQLDLLFIHIPKNAGTSIYEAMLAADPSTDFGHWPWRYYEAKQVCASVSFAVVRNPWDRAYSCYRYAIKEESYWHGANKQHGVHSDYHLLKDRTFQEAIQLLYDHRALLDLPELKRENFRWNWSYQHPFICDTSGKIQVDKCFCYEEMGILCAWLKDQYALEVPYLNTSTVGENYRDAYDDETARLVREVYQRDIEVFDFEF